MADYRRRRSLRLQDYDYGQGGAYFVTVCAHRRRTAFGRIVRGRMMINEVGEIVKDCWLEIPAHSSHVELDEHVIMPNHLHGILVITKGGPPDTQQLCTRSSARECRGVACYARPPRPHGPESGSIGAIVRSFKGAVTRRLRAGWPAMDFPLWQRNYYEHVIRDEQSLYRIRDYIVTNPFRWVLDRENPSRTGVDGFDRWLDNFKDRPPARKD